MRKYLRGRSLENWKIGKVKHQYILHRHTKCPEMDTTFLKIIVKYTVRHTKLLLKESNLRN